METFSNHHDDDFEEVESPFARVTPKTNTKKSFERTPLRSFTTEPPLIVENRREKLSSVSRVNYIDEDDEEEEVTERRVTIRTPSKKKSSKMSVTKKLIWGFAILLLFRLFMMDRGVYEHVKMNQILSAKTKDHQMLRLENRELSLEIQKILYDKQYQKSLAKEYLGVIAQDEFVILFAADSLETSTLTDRPL